MPWFNKNGNEGREDVESKAQVDLDFSSDRWPRDLDFYNIITIIQRTDVEEGGQQEKVRWVDAEHNMCQKI